MPLPIGGWRLNVNGLEGGLMIESVETATSVVEGSIHAVSALGNSRIRGSWNEATQCLTFVVIRVGSQDLVLPTFFRGLLFGSPLNAPPGQDISWTLAGSVWDVTLSGDIGVHGTSRRNEFGWFAQLTQVV